MQNFLKLCLLGTVLYAPQSGLCAAADWGSAATAGLTKITPTDVIAETIAQPTVSTVASTSASTVASEAASKILVDAVPTDAAISAINPIVDAIPTDAAVSAINPVVDLGTEVITPDLATMTGEYVAENLAAGMDPGAAYSAAMEAANQEFANLGSQAASNLASEVSSVGNAGDWTQVSDGIWFNNATGEEFAGVSPFASSVTTGSDAVTTAVGNTGDWTQVSDGIWFNNATGEEFAGATPPVSEAAKPSAELAAQQSGQATSTAADATNTAMVAAPMKANETNVGQYVLLILQSVEGVNQEDATRQVTIQGAEKLQQSQGSPQDSTLGDVGGVANELNIVLDGSSLSAAARAMASLLQSNTVDLSLLDYTHVENPLERVHLTGTEAGTGERQTFDTRTENKIKHKRRVLLQQYGVAAQVIAEGANLVSSQFYQRVSGIAASVKGTYGTLGAMSVLNDSERYPYFEMVRQMSLTAVQLGLKGAINLDQVKPVVMEGAK